MQSEKANVQQSLFGGGNAEADIQKPEPLPHEPWTKLEMLNKEREVIGIYLSSHPLDDFSVIIRHYCHSTLGDLQDLPSMKNKDFTVAGMVTSVTHLTTKPGSLTVVLRSRITTVRTNSCSLARITKISGGTSTKATTCW